MNIFSDIHSKAVHAPFPQTLQLSFQANVFLAIQPFFRIVFVTAIPKSNPAAKVVYFTGYFISVYIDASTPILMQNAASKITFSILILFLAINSTANKSQQSHFSENHQKHQNPLRQGLSPQLHHTPLFCSCAEGFQISVRGYAPCMI